MVVFQLFEHMGKIIAPDPDYYEKALDPSAEPEPSLFWDFVAPDPKFSTPAATTAKKEAYAAANTPLSHAAAALLLSPAPHQPKQELASFVPCSDCLAKLCPTCRQNVGGCCTTKENSTANNEGFSTPPAVAQSSTRSSASASASSSLFLLQSPRPVTIPNDPNVTARVTTACKGVATTLQSPPGVRKLDSTVFRWCSATTVLLPAAQNKLRKALVKKPALLSARSHGLGLLCPDGYTPFMAAAYSNNAAAAEILWEFATEQEKQSVLAPKPDGGDGNNSTVHAAAAAADILNDRNTVGQTAYHIAAEKGHREMLTYLRTLHHDVFGSESAHAEPIDLMGTTPFGMAVMSTNGKAIGNKAAHMAQLYRENDASVLGHSLPLRERVVYPASNSKAVWNMTAGLSEIPGKRVLMEDYTVTKVSENSVVWLAVCDGHGDGGKVSEYVAKTLVTALDESPSLRNSLQSTADIADDTWRQEFERACLSTDANLRKKGMTGGSVAVVLAVTLNQVVVGNVGDCRCILVQKKNDDAVDAITDQTANMSLTEGKEEEKKPSAAHVTKPLSTDHKPNEQGEAERIEKAGYRVVEEAFMEDGQEVVIHKIELSEGNRMACSRSFGDFEYKARDTLDPKDQAVTADPEVVVHSRTMEDSFLVAACDGVWDVMSNEDVAKFVTQRMEHYTSTASFDSSIMLPTIGDELLLECLRLGSGDNMSAVIVGLSPQHREDSSAVHDAISPPLQGKTLDYSQSTTA